MVMMNDMISFYSMLLGLILYQDQVSTLLKSQRPCLLYIYIFFFKIPISLDSLLENNYLL